MRLILSKKGILINTIETLNSIGIENPKVAVLAANEQVSPKMPVTLMPRHWLKWRKRGTAALYY